MPRRDIDHSGTPTDELQHMFNHRSGGIRAEETKQIAHGERPI